MSSTSLKRPILGLQNVSTVELAATIALLLLITTSWPDKCCYFLNATQLLIHLTYPVIKLKLELDFFWEPV
jgi:hypothetical protein